MVEWERGGNVEKHFNQLGYIATVMCLELCKTVYTALSYHGDYLRSPSHSLPVHNPSGSPSSGNPYQSNGCLEAFPGSRCCARYVFEGCSTDSDVSAVSRRPARIFGAASLDRCTELAARVALSKILGSTGNHEDGGTPSSSLAGGAPGSRHPQHRATE